MRLKIVKLLKSPFLMILGIFAFLLFFYPYRNLINSLFSLLIAVPLTRETFEYPLNIDFSFAHDVHLQPPKVASINDPEFNFIHSPSWLCEPQNDTFLSLILVKSSVKNARHRSILRRTWFRELNTHNMKAAFLIGNSRNLDLNPIDQEASFFKDIIQYDLEDSYYNNTFKAMAGFHWQRSRCSRHNFNFLVMMDDDYFVNVGNLEKHLSGISKEHFEDFVGGYVFPSSYPQRLQSSKWYLSKDEYRWRVFPPYPTAGFYIVTKDTADKISRAIPFIQYFRFDDVFIGIVLYRLRILPRDYGSLIAYSPPLFLSGYTSLVSCHTYGKPELIEKVWNFLNPLT